MSKLSNIRALHLSDLARLKIILDQTELFPSDMFEEMTDPFFNDSDCVDIWHVYENENEIEAFLYCVHEKLTKGTWNVLAIAVLPAFQNKGIGSALMNNIEQVLRRGNHRLCWWKPLPSQSMKIQEGFTIALVTIRKQ